MFREPDKAGSQLSPQQEIFDILHIHAQQGGLCLSALIEAVRDQSRTVDLPHVNAVLTQPHWRKEHDPKTL